ncbi:Membrane-associated guanylate kinase, WW and PDZ domain-containing protein 2 [Trichinella pseudospiralis]|uniref:Membrane-associated guanylate kinase, WW and PDZ domain-containing protein 2 n=1 Tax=Trichinella pseudospiralis TaxID=6337 RepID=A0A0V0XYK2_TRIPS|nr:Membrane-associated guanylate kinase, WW and PDZ domain-containing protein 2 [Trichinella pseudospiralis]
MVKESSTSGHWSALICDVVLSFVPQEKCPFVVTGGSENGFLLSVAHLRSERLTYLTGEQRLQNDDVLLEARGRKLSGLTSYDAQKWLDHCCERGGPVAVKFLRPGHIVSDLRRFLSMRFPKDSEDHQLQNDIRENVYLKTVPCTTRKPKPGEIDGVDYKFVTKEQFLALERNGDLLESGGFEGNLYGTPKPPKLENSANDFDLVNDVFLSDTDDQHQNLQQQREGKIVTSSESVVITGGAGVDTSNTNDNTNSTNTNNNHIVPSSNLLESDVMTATVVQMDSLPKVDQIVEQDTRPLPANWEMAYTDAGEPYFIDHNTGTTHWTDPRSSDTTDEQQQQQSFGASSSSNVELLPYGWERVDDPQYGIYYVDHINKKTQYDKPELTTADTADDAAQRQFSILVNGDLYNSSNRRYSASNATANCNAVDVVGQTTALDSPHKLLFTRNPNELRGELITVTLVKGLKGLGFTLVGNDACSTDEEFLQIKNVLPGGPAYRNGRLRMGDILVHVNEICVLGYTQDEVIRVFQTIAVGQQVELQVCRGYPLLFDPSDPANDFVTQDAYGSVSGSDHSVAGSAELAVRMFNTEVRIVKGSMGFGFTIADSPFGQKVKKILDRPRCQGLVEGDILCEVNGNNVRSMNHTEIVDVLRDCPVGRLTTIVVQRLLGMDMQNNNNNDDTWRPKQPPAVPAKPTNRIVNGGELGRPVSLHVVDGHSGGTEYNNLRRSKTPTSETTRTAQDRHSMMPELRPRSKTPGPAFNLSRNNMPKGGGTLNGYLKNGHDSCRNNPVYENFVRVHQQQPEVISNNSNTTTTRPMSAVDFRNGRVKTPSSSYFASATPNYVPAAVYTGRYTTRSAVPLSRTGFFHDNTVGLENEEAYEHVTVNLLRQAAGFGFRLCGGTEENSQVRVGQLVPDGAAFQDGRLQLDDEIVQIDGHHMLGSSHQQAVQLMNNASKNGHVKLVVRRRRRRKQASSEMSRSISMPLAPCSRRYPFDVTIARKENEGFGFVIISSVNRAGSAIDPFRQFKRLAPSRPQPIVGRIINGSPAARCGQLRVGDRIVAVNGMSILNMPHGDIVNLIKDSGYVVTLSVGSPDAEIDAPSSNYDAANGTMVGVRLSSNSPPKSTPKRYSSIESVLSELNRASPPISESLEYDCIVVSEPPTPARVRWNLVDGGGEQPSTSDFSFITRLLFKLIEDEEYFAVELQRGAKGFGFSIRGGREFSNMPLFVLRIAEGGPADLDRRLQVGDQLLEINGVTTANMTHAEAIELIKRESSVRLLVRRLANVPAQAHDGISNIGYSLPCTMKNMTNGNSLNILPAGSTWVRNT